MPKDWCSINLDSPQYRLSLTSSIAISDIKDVDIFFLHQVSYSMLLFSPICFKFSMCLLGLRFIFFHLKNSKKNYAFFNALIDFGGYFYNSMLPYGAKIKAPNY